MSTQADSERTPLPKLREDLRLLPKPEGASGGPGTLIFDPIAHRYFEIDLETSHMLAMWSQCSNIAELRTKVSSTFGNETSDEEVAALIRFLDESSLLLEAEGGWRAYAGKAAKAKPGLFSWLLHNYLYIRIPILRPYRLLKATLPLVSWAFSARFYWLTAAIGSAGLYLVSRQWDEYLASFAPLMTLQGAALFAVALTIVKIFHELGHAYAAVRFGCRVPTMGMALVVMLPMLYTDVTDAWRLPRRPRMLIAGAGIIVELTLAALATFLWAFLPDGQTRSLVFIIATTSWVTSIAVNLNPLMRMDGYFLLADWTRISNLQSRANALGVWQLRELLFNLGDPSPEKSPAETQRWMTIYAWLVWIYRLIIFTGIALAVYHYFFKVLGIILFAVEIIWFIALPIVREIRVWWANRSRVRASGRTWATLGGMAALVLVLVVPWSSRIEVPAIRENAVYARLYPSAPAVIKKVHVAQGQAVAAGDLLLELEDSRFKQDLRLVRLKLNLLRIRTARRVADTADRSATLSLRQEMAMLEAQRAGLEKQRSELMIRAPFAGRIAEMNTELHAGRWISRTEEVALLVAPEHGAVVSGYIDHDDLARIKEGAVGRFTPEDPMRAAEEVVVSDIAYSAAASIEIPYLASTFGGAVQVLEDKERGLVPAQATYLVTLKPSAPGQSIDQVTRGSVILEARPESLLASVWRHTLNVLVRESGV